MFDMDWFWKIQHPSRYLGGEINSIRKNHRDVDVTVALAFPDVYEVGMSHLGLKLLYHILNRKGWIAAERAFCPWVDLEKELQHRGLPLCSLESGKSLAEFDIVGFSLQHELCLTNVLTMLHLAGIPFLAAERKEDFPLVIAGGPACFNPEPFADFFDALLVGDGEDAVLEICETVKRAKRGNASKAQMLDLLSRIEGMYIPGFFDVTHREDGTISAVRPLKTHYREVRKRVVADLNCYPLPDSPVVPFAEVVHDRLALEISRGCTRGCRFCQAGMIYRPVRERDPSAVLNSAVKSLGFTGFEELSLLSLSSGDYGCLGPLLRALMDRQVDGKIALSLPSLRIDSLDPAWFEEIKRVRKTGFTLAPEAGNDRLRRVINKKLTDREILGMSREIFNAGWELIKLYFMIGLPGEGDGDLHDMVRLITEVAKQGGRRAKVNASVAVFVPKAHTPFMWSSQVTMEESRRKIDLIRSGLKHSRVRLKWNQPEMSWLEGIFSRGDRRLSKAVIGAWQKGARYDAWSEHFKLPLWVEALNDAGLDPAFYLHRQRPPEESFPWEHIRSGVTRDFLLREHGRAFEEKPTPDCRDRCLDCGVCDHHAVAPVLCRGWNGRESVQETPSPPQEATRFRVVFSKSGRLRYLSHLELVRVFVRALKRASIPLVYSGGFHPLPRLSFATALPVGTESLHETMDMVVHGLSSAEILEKSLAEQLPDGIRILSVNALPLGAPSPRTKESTYEVDLDGLTINPAALEEFLQAESFPVVKKSKKGERTVDLRSLVKSAHLFESGKLSLVLRHTTGPELKPADILKNIFSFPEETNLNVVKTNEVVN